MNIRAKIYGSSKPQEPIFRDKRPKGAKSDALDSIAVRREESRRGNSRTEDRHRLSEETVTITHDGVSHQAQLINLSGGGVMVRGPLELKLWDTVELHLGEHGTIECAVRWIRDDRVGLEFAHETRLECSSDEMASVLRDVITRSFPDASFEESGEQQQSAPPQPTVEELTPPAMTNSRCSASDHRRAARHPLIWTGTLHLGHWRAAVRVRNISSTGAMIECTESIDVGAEPVLQIGDETSLSGTVQWVVGAQVGLKFHSPFDMRLLAQAKPEVATAPTQWLRPAYLETSSDTAEAASDPWDPRWQRLSMSEINLELEGFLKR